MENTILDMLQVRRDEVTVHLTEPVMLQSLYSPSSLLVTAQHLRRVHDLYALQLA
ncbi:hypothetical protein [Xanthomonas nasturtii]|uniref:hypothetical protein n=1 Tax=Xanthomonas nasturtii TaxID=1843581 RepID=UPI0013A58C81|nr:hypothetical protein [Xanthomonas nasturtii]MCL1560752.1 hypothetical protein [Xanthomonas nasturtii]WVL58847.1 hypothetical protein M3O54_012205 [Xanthomonas nasturtii]